MYNPQEVVDITSKVIEYMETSNKTVDIGVKVAALNSAAAIYTNTIQAQTMAGVIGNLLGDKK